ncbi:hypothetical protein HZS_5353, partial [Henneguya salminicola]
KRKLKKNGGNEKRRKPSSPIPSWEEIIIELKNFNILQTSNNTKIFEINHDSVPIDQQLYNMKKNIHNLLKSREYDSVIISYHSMMELIGKECHSREVVEQDLEKIYRTYTISIISDGLLFTDDEDDTFDEFQDNEQHEVSSYSSSEPVEEKQFNLNKYMARYACLSVIKVCSRLVKMFHTNESEINKEIFDFIDYISFTLNYPQLFYHISFFRIFKQILTDFPESNKFHLISKRIMLKYFNDIDKTGNGAGADILFWKSLAQLKDIYEKPNQISYDFYPGSCSPPEFDVSTNNIQYNGGVDLLQMNDQIQINSPLNGISPNISQFKFSDDSNDANGKACNDTAGSVCSAIISIDSSSSINLQINKSNTNFNNQENCFSLCNPQHSGEDLSLFLKNVEERCISLCREGYSNTLSWVVRNLDTETQQKYLLLLGSFDHLEIIPDMLDVYSLKMPQVINFLKYIGFLPPTDATYDPYWKIPPGIDPVLTQTIRT